MYHYTASKQPLNENNISDSPVLKSNMQQNKSLSDSSKASIIESDTPRRNYKPHVFNSDGLTRGISETSVTKGSMIQRDIARSSSQSLNLNLSSSTKGIVVIYNIVIVWFYSIIY